MKYEILDIITEAYDNDEISPEDALAYADFVECADLSDGDDVEILTEMVDILSWDDDYYMTEGRNIGKKVAKEKKESKFKAKLANAKAFVSRNKGKIAAGALGAAGIAGAAGLGYAAGRAGSDRRNATTIQGLNDTLSAKSKKLDETRQLFKQANTAKRSAIASSKRLQSQSDDLLYQRNMQAKTARWLNDELQKSNGRWAKTLHELDKLKEENRKLSEREALRRRGDAYKKALSGTGVADSIKNRASGNIDQFKPATAAQIAALQQKLNSNTNKSKKKRK